MKGKKKKLTGRWKREMRKYRWNLIWKTILINCLAIAIFWGVCSWVRGKTNIEIGSYFTDARTSVQDYIINVLSDPGLFGAEERLIESKIEIKDRQEDTDGFSFLNRVYELGTGELIYENPNQKADDKLQKFVDERIEMISGANKPYFQVQLYNSAGGEETESGIMDVIIFEGIHKEALKLRGNYLMYGQRVYDTTGKGYVVLSAMYANPYTWYPQMFRILVVGTYSCLILLLGSVLLLLISCRHRKAKLLSKEQNEELMLAIAHDIRGPLMAISGYAENMGQLIEAEEGRHYRDEILSNVSYMNSMITNMICYLKEQEADKSEKSAVSIHEIFEKKAAQYQNLIDKNKLMIAICGDVKLQTDAKMFGYIADNLVTNAVKYAKPETEVQIQIDKDSVVVRNQAAHIPDCTPEELWNPTKKGDDVRTGRNGGGMGLGIVRRFLDACGYTGEIRMEDDVFEVTINLK